MLAKELTKAGYPMSRAGIYLWFSDKSRPNPQTAAGISEVLNVSLAEVRAQYTLRRHTPIRHPNKVKFKDIAELTKLKSISKSDAIRKGTS